MMNNPETVLKFLAGCPYFGNCLNAKVQAVCCKCYYDNPELWDRCKIITRSIKSYQEERRKGENGEI